MEPAPATATGGPAPAPTPFTIVIDTAEKAPYTFAHPLAVDASRPPLRIVTEQRKLFIAGTQLSIDYSLAGYTDRVAVERKSWSDFLMTLGQTRARFQRKLGLLHANYEFAVVVVEAEWGFMLANQHPHSRLNLKSALCSVLAWKQRFTRVHWEFVPGREMGEVVTARHLERFWRDRNGK